MNTLPEQYKAIKRIECNAENQKARILKCRESIALASEVMWEFKERCGDDLCLSIDPIFHWPIYLYLTISEMEIVYEIIEFMGSKGMKVAEKSQDGYGDGSGKVEYRFSDAIKNERELGYREWIKMAVNIIGDSCKFIEVGKKEEPLFGLRCNEE